MNPSAKKRHPRSPWLISLLRWFDTSAGGRETEVYGSREVDWMRVVPFITSHAMCFAVFWVGWSWAAVVTAGSLYVLRMFAITGFYHRYFSHNAFKTSRPWQFVFAVMGNSAVQRGPLWWASHHRHHHQHADEAEDMHSPVRHGFWWSHMGWLMSKAYFRPRMNLVGDWSRYPELRWLDRFDVVVPLCLAVALFLFGAGLERVSPGLGTSGPQMLVWGFFLSTIVLFHATATINSLCHMFGRKRYRNCDESRNNLSLALLTLGEGWHNNHHHFAVSARQGFFWWEIDITYYLLRLLSAVGIVRDLKPVPQGVLERDRVAVPTAS